MKMIFDSANDVCDMDGTLGDNLADYYRNPIELGWGHSIHWNHEFVGKEALQKIAANDPRHAVTLEWDMDDILDVMASYMRPGTPYMFIDWPRDPNQFANQQFRVEDADGNVIGVTSLRTYTLYQRKHISLCCIDSAFSEPGNEVYIIWGDRDKYPIKRIKAVVNKFPSLDLTRNDTAQHSSHCSRE